MCVCVCVNNSAQWIRTRNKKDKNICTQKIFNILYTK